MLFHHYQQPPHQQHQLNSLEKLALVCGRKISSSTERKSMTLDEEISSYVKAVKSAKSFQEFWVLHHDHFHV